MTNVIFLFTTLEYLTFKHIPFYFSIVTKYMYVNLSLWLSNYSSAQVYAYQIFIVYCVLSSLWA